MSNIITLPSLSDTDPQVIIERYYFGVGEAVEQGQALVMVRSDRFVWDVPAPMSGTLSAIIVEQGTSVTRGAPLAKVASNEVEEGDRRPNQADRTAKTQVRLRATPVARRIAALHGVDLAAIGGTGRGGCITRADVLALLEELEKPEDEDQVQASGKTKRWDSEQQEAGSRHVDAANAFTASSMTPDTYIPSQPFAAPSALTAIEVDLTNVLAAIEQQEHAQQQHVSFKPFAYVTAAVIKAISKHRMVNSTWTGDGVIVRGNIHLLIEQVDQGNTQTHLIHNAADFNLLGLARQLIPAQTKDTVQNYETEPTFALSEWTAPWWQHARLNGNYTAHLTIGAIQQHPHVLETNSGDLIALRPTMILLLTYDARVLGQFEADAFLSYIKQQLEHLRGL